LVGRRQVNDVVLVVQTMDFRVQSVVSKPTIEVVNIVVFGDRDDGVGLVVGRRERADLYNILHRDRWHRPARMNSWAGAGGRGN
jgi:hypothetical protein